MTFKNSFALSLGASLGATAYFYYNNNTFEITKYNIEKGLSKPFKILQLSDLHDNQFGRENSKLLWACTKCEPDVILLTGDMTTQGGKGLFKTAKFIERLSKIAPTFSILGNHEQRDGLEDVVSMCYTSAGATVLTNQLWAGDINGVTLNILGLCEGQGVSRKDYFKSIFGKIEYKDNRQGLKSLSKRDGIRLVLSHYPENFALIDELSYSNYPFDVMFSGHAHGGQIRLPYIGGVFSSGQGLFPQYYDGIYQKAKSTLVVSRGLGNSTFVPRISNRPQLVLTTLV